MSVDYDLVIIGATATARAAAMAALNRQVRVVAVLPTATYQHHPQRDLYPYALLQAAKFHHITRSRQQQPASYPWKYAMAAIDRLDRQSNWSLLEAMGIETIVGDGEFCRRPQLAFNVANRSLCARAYLIATGAQPAYPLISGLQEVGYVDLDRLPTVSDRQLPLHWAIVGTEAIGVELAQALARLGHQVSLVVDTAQILPYEAPEVGALIQAQLEADGVEIYLQAAVTSVSRDGGAKLVAFNNETIAVDEIFVALPERPLVEPLNLLGVGVDYDRNGISIDNTLQTSHPQIYACGSACGNVNGGYRSDSLNRYEAKIAVRNALARGGKTKIDYDSYQRLPWAVYTDPPLARVGLSGAASANRQQAIVLRGYFQAVPAAILANTTTGFCQMVVSRSGKILGAEIVGPNAPELIQFLALAIQQQLKIDDLINHPRLSPSYIDCIYAAARSWQLDRYEYRRQSSWWQRWLDWWQHRLR